MGKEESNNMEEKLHLFPYHPGNGILIYCKACGTEMEETGSGRYDPIEYESEKYERECDNCYNS